MRFILLLICFSAIVYGQWHQRLADRAAKWTTEPDAVLPGRRDAIYWCLHDDMYVFGGRTAEGRQRDLWKLEAEDSRYLWLEGSADAMDYHQGQEPGPRSGGVGWVLLDTFYLLGGRDDTESVYRDLWTYDRHRRRWTLMENATMPAARFGASGWVDKTLNRGFVFGGRDHSTTYADTWMYRAEERSWTLVRSPTSPSARDDAAVAVTDEVQRVYLFGGRTQNGTFLNDLWFFDRSNMMWQQVQDVVEAAPGVRENAMMWFGDSSTLILFGGRTGSNSAAGDMWSHDLDEIKAWNHISLVNSPSSRSSASYCTFGHATLLIGGARGGDSNLMNDLWAYGTTAIEEAATQELTTALLIANAAFGAISMISIIVFVVALIVWGMCKRRNKAEFI